MHVNPPHVMYRPGPFFGTWDEKNEVRRQTLDRFRFTAVIPIKGICSRNEVWPKTNNPIVHFGGLGTHWVRCWREGGEYKYFDSFGFPRLQNEKTPCSLQGKTFFRKDSQIQWEWSVRCGYYCLLFLNKQYKGRSFQEVLSKLSDDLRSDEAVVKQYFSC